MCVPDMIKRHPSPNREPTFYLYLPFSLCKSPFYWYYILLTTSAHVTFIIKNKNKNKNNDGNGKLSSQILFLNSSNMSLKEVLILIFFFKNRWMGCMRNSSVLRAPHVLHTPWKVCHFLPCWRSSVWLSHHKRTRFCSTSNNRGGEY